jgi:hypothetical protein
LLAKFEPARDVMLTVVFVSALDGVMEVSCGGPDITGDVVGTTVVVVVVVSASTPAGTSRRRKNKQTKRRKRFIPVFLHQVCE